MKTISFFNFANGCHSFNSEPVPYATLDVILRILKKAKKLASKGVEATYDENADMNAACTGTIYAGLRAVARFRVIDHAPEHTETLRRDA